MQPVDMTEPRRAIDHRHHDRGDQVAAPRSVVARQPHRARLRETVEEAARFRVCIQWEFSIASDGHKKPQAAGQNDTPAASAA